MSLAYKSPSQRTNQPTEAYFTPLNMPTLMTTTTEDTNSNNTPYYTAPINPVIHQDFLNAIQARHASQPTLLPTPMNEVKSSPLLTNLSMGTLASRRRMAPLNTNTSRHDPIPININQLSTLLTTYKSNPSGLLLIDVRSFVHFLPSRIQSAIHIFVPKTILKRPTFTIDKLYEVIVSESSRERLKAWNKAEHIVFYDQQSQSAQEDSICAYLGTKLIQEGFKGQLNFLQGGYEAFSLKYKHQCESTPISGGSPAMSLGLPTSLGESVTVNRANRKPLLRLSNLPVSTPIGPFTAPMPQFENQAFNPFFSNIRQNMELSHGPIRERFPIRLPPQCSVDPNNNYQVQASITPRCVAGGHMDKNKRGSFIAPQWLQRTIWDNGAQILAETYEKLERTEQRRLQNIMHFHSKHTNNPAEFPFSIVAGIEMGTLNRYTNIWPFEYTRVKIRDHQVSDYINASYIQFIESDDIISDARPNQTDTHQMKVIKSHSHSSPYRRYISTQGPLPATFNDFWQVVWEQNSRILLMLTKEEEMNKIKCHRYWPSTVGVPVQYGNVSVSLIEESSQTVENIKKDSINPDDVIITRTFHLSRKMSSGEVVRRVVTHFQYTGWMDFGVPDNPLGTLQIIEMADKAQVALQRQEDNIGPMIVHCSAGCGRSGAFCAIDTVIHRLSSFNENDNDIMKDILLETISRFREQRLSMVQTLRQFVFCYEAIWWWILGYTNDRSLCDKRQLHPSDTMDTSS
ncbi:protein-tyrosine phosphatase-like protein [Pilobolus umbonatus]|nr:protein-tyrosine phosphatase-like protein [Pilobolus umbonatus]